MVLIKYSYNVTGGIKVDYEYLDYALEDAIVALNFVQDMEGPLGVCFADIGRSIATIEELRRQIKVQGRYNPCVIG